MNFNLPPNTEELTRAVLEDDLLEGGIEIMCCGLILTRHGMVARERHVEEISILEHELFEASGNLKQAMVVNTTYEKNLCDQATELERLQADTVAENARLKKAMEEVGRREASLEEEVVSLKKRKEAVEAELEKTMDDTVALISQSFELTVWLVEVLYDGPPPSGQFDQEMDVFDSSLVPVEEVQTL